MRVVCGALILLAGFFTFARAQAPEPIPDPAHAPGIENTIGDTSTTDALGEYDAEAIENELEHGSVPLSSRRLGKVEEIITSARKRDEFLQDTPVAVTVLKPQQLLDSGTIYLPQIQDLVPNLTVIPRRDGASFTIRGVGAFPNPWFDQGVGLYIDDVFIPRQQGNITELIDIEQIEVLRGPQGTLFGKNSAGGAVRITTMKPSMDLEGATRIRASSLTELQTRAMLNLPLGSGWLEDKLAVRLNFGSSHRSDYVYNHYLEEGTGGWNTLGFLGSLRFQPRDDLVFDVSGLWNQSRGSGSAGICTYIQPSSLKDVMNLPPAPSFGGIGPRYDYDSDDYREACQRAQRYDTALDTEQLDQTTSQIIWATGLWDVGDTGWFEDLQAKFIGSYRWYETWARIDLDGTEYRVWESDSTGTDPEGGTPENGWSSTQEIQVNAAALDGRLTFVAGAFGYLEHIKQDSLLLTFPGTLAETGGGRGILQFGADNWDWSIYTQADFAVTDWMQLTGGVRYAQEKKEVDRLVYWPASTGSFPGPEACQPGTGNGNVDSEGRAIECVPVAAFPGVPGSNRVPASGVCTPGTGPVFGEDGMIHATDTVCDPEPWDRSQKFENVSPMAAIRFTLPDDSLVDTPIDHFMTYFQYARGYKGGGFNGGALDNDPRQFDAFRPEFTDSYEIGFKTTSFEDRMTFKPDVLLHRLPGSAAADARDHPRPGRVRAIAGPDRCGHHRVSPLDGRAHPERGRQRHQRHRSRVPGVAGSVHRAAGKHGSPGCDSQRLPGFGESTHRPSRRRLGSEVRLHSEVERPPRPFHAAPGRNHERAVALRHPHAPPRLDVSKRGAVVQPVFERRRHAGRRADPAVQSAQLPRDPPLRRRRGDGGPLRREPARRDLLRRQPARPAPHGLDPALLARRSSLRRRAHVQILR